MSEFSDKLNRVVINAKVFIKLKISEIELVDKFGGDAREFIADHPFLFYIEDDKTGAKLFSGIINNPEF